MAGVDRHDCDTDLEVRHLSRNDRQGGERVQIEPLTHPKLQAEIPGNAGVAQQLIDGVAPTAVQPGLDAHAHDERLQSSWLAVIKASGLVGLPEVSTIVLSVSHPGC
jgi:hypothetical protein